jgi:hypothetical protein
MNAETKSQAMMKGYVFIQKQEVFEKKRRESLFDEFVDNSPTDGYTSFAGNGWYPMSEAIRAGEFVRILAVRDSVRVEARFNFNKDIREESGSYQIKGGLYQGSGTFLNVARKPREDVDFNARDNINFENFFVCHSHSTRDGVPFLRWRIVLGDLSDSSSISS